MGDDGILDATVTGELSRALDGMKVFTICAVTLGDSVYTLYIVGRYLE